MIRHLRKSTIAASVAAFCVTSSFAGPLSADVTIGNTDFRSYAIGQMRSAGTGTLAVTGLSGTVTRALLYWHGPTNSTSLTANANVTMNGTSVTGTNIGGLADNNCWGYSNSQAYRADVTSVVTGNGNYALTNFSKSDSEINGAQLLVFFNDGNATNNRDVVVFSGNDSNQAYSGPPVDPAGWQGALSGVNYSTGTVNMTLGVSDGQQTGSDGTLSLGTFSTVVAYDGATAQIGNGVSSRGSLWDIVTYDVTTAFSVGANTLNYGLSTTGNVGGDCVSLIVAAFDTPAGAVVVPVDPVSVVTTPVPVPVGGLPAGVGIALLGIYGLRRRRQTR
jgi:hypothetical protein